MLEPNNPAVAMAKKKLDALNAERKKWTAVIEALQAVCEHKDVYVGHGHNSDFYECSECGKESEN